MMFTCLLLLLLFSLVWTRFIPPAGSSSTFAIRHYCGTVIYDTYSLLNANADTLADDIIATFDGKV